MFSEKFHKAAGFSLVELMVVVTIISGLAVIGMPRFRTMVARARQAEAKTTLEQIHKLNTLHQTAKDKYASWGKSESLGYDPSSGGTKCEIGTPGGTSGRAKGSTNGDCTGCSDPDNNARNVTKSTCDGHSDSCTWIQHTPGAKSLGFQLSSCSSSRYQYWIDHTVHNGKEHYIAYAYSPSDSNSRIFPTCDGTKKSDGTTRGDQIIAHAVATGITQKVTQGDFQGVNEDKVYFHRDIVKACE